MESAVLSLSSQFYMTIGCLLNNSVKSDLNYGKLKAKVLRGRWLGEVNCKNLFFLLTCPQ